MPPSDDMEKFRTALDAAKRVVVMTGAGISAESGMPTFRGAGGLWRQFDATLLATPIAFEKNPSLVWEFYHYRREIVAKCKPNPGHYALTALQKKLHASSDDRKCTIITQNIDRLHQAAGTMDVVELHGTLWTVKRMGQSGTLEEEGVVWEDRTQPLVPALEGRGAPDLEGDGPLGRIPEDQLPLSEDGKLLRPGVVWFEEQLDNRVMFNTEALLEECDMFIVVGTSAVVYPAAAFASQLAAKGVPVVEFNLEATPNTGSCTFAFQGKSGELLPSYLGVEEEVAKMMPKEAAPEPEEGAPPAAG